MCILSNCASCGHLCNSTAFLYLMSQCVLRCQSINHLFAHNTSSSETTRASRRDEQDSQATGALMASLTNTKFPKTVVKQVQMSTQRCSFQIISWLLVMGENQIQRCVTQTQTTAIRQVHRRRRGWDAERTFYPPIKPPPLQTHTRRLGIFRLPPISLRLLPHRGGSMHYPARNSCANLDHISGANRFLFLVHFSLILCYVSVQ